ncbi:MAG: hypothetical protein ACF8NJ_09965 [Phycisphaerales bacterium JB038]
MPCRNHLGIPNFWLRLYPELRFFESREAMGEARQQFRVDQAGRMRLLTIGAGVFMALVAAFAMDRLRAWGLSFWGSLLVLIALGTVLGTVGSIVFLHRPYIRWVRRYLCAQGIPVCLKCGYDLRARTEARCPECGAAFDEALLSQATDEDEDAA